MRLPLRHPPTGLDARVERCAHLDALIDSAVGLPLGAAARSRGIQRGRGRHGNALQWHFGLEPQDGDPRLDWEDRIELKLVSVWSRSDGTWACDKLKVCDYGIDPWHKLGNVLWVFADRMTRVVLGGLQTTLRAAMRDRLERSWGLDPHFEHPHLFVEAREHDGEAHPAYYLAARWFAEEGVLPRDTSVTPLPFDGRWWSKVRGEHGRRNPLPTLVAPEAEAGSVSCPRCRGAVRYDVAVLRERGWAPGLHVMPLGELCARHGHYVVDATRLPAPRTATVGEARAAVEGWLKPEELWRHADRVVEPEDHEH